MQERDLQKQKQIEQQLNIPSALNELGPHHYPLFVPVQKLIYMLDASLPQSFFARDQDGNIIGVNSFMGWHSESSMGGDKGTMMINSSFKMKIDYDDIISKLGEKLMDFED